MTWLLAEISSVKGHAQITAQPVSPDDLAMRRASRAKGPADNKLCATKVEQFW
jgi:hypothetical protein